MKKRLASFMLLRKKKHPAPEPKPSWPSKENPCLKVGSPSKNPEKPHGYSAPTWGLPGGPIIKICLGCMIDKKFEISESEPDLSDEGKRMKALQFFINNHNAYVENTQKAGQKDS